MTEPLDLEPIKRRHARRVDPGFGPLGDVPLLIAEVERLREFLKEEGYVSFQDPPLLPLRSPGASPPRGR